MKGRCQRFQFLLLLLLLLSPSGCTSINYSRSDPNGETVKFSTKSWGTKKSIAEGNYSVGTNGARAFNVKGYQNDQVEAIKAAVAAAVQAALTTAKP